MTKLLAIAFAIAFVSTSVSAQGVYSPTTGPNHIEREVPKGVKPHANSVPCTPPGMPLGWCTPNTPTTGTCPYDPGTCRELAERYAREHRGAPVGAPQGVPAPVVQTQPVSTGGVMRVFTPKASPGQLGDAFREDISTNVLNAPSQDVGQMINAITGFQQPVTQALMAGGSYAKCTPNMVRDMRQVGTYRKPGGGYGFAPVGPVMTGCPIGLEVLMVGGKVIGFDNGFFIAAKAWEGN